jgi:hypothetical protein
LSFVVWFRIRIPIADPDPGEHNLPTKKEKVKKGICFEVLVVLFGGLLEVLRGCHD